MDRRLRGAMVMVAALIAVVVISGGTRTLSGDASSVPIPPPPNVGDCLLSAPSGAWVGGRTGVSLEVQPCAEERFGEITAVSAAAEESVCAIGDGRPAVYLDAAVEAVGWSSRVSGEATVIGPDYRQRFAGQSWTACLLTPSNQTPYREPAAGSYSAGDLEPAFASCLLDTAGAATIDCAEPHRVEMLGEMVPAAAAGTADTCAQFASAVIGSDDPTMAGQLRVSTSTIAQPLSRLNESNPSQGVPICVVESVDGRFWTGTLVGRGSAPISWVK